MYNVMYDQIYVTYTVFVKTFYIIFVKTSARLVNDESFYNLCGLLNIVPEGAPVAMYVAEQAMA